MKETLSKLQAKVGEHGQVEYHLIHGEQHVPLNAHLSQELRLEFTGNIFCTSCSRKTKKSYSQGHCFPCSQRLASCDMCIVKPEKCHYHLGTCREPEWGEKHCFNWHIVYLSNTTGLKIGITRQTQVPTRWLDQGAIQALPLFRVKTRLQAGLLEVAIAKHVADKTNWRALLKGEAAPKDMLQEARVLLELAKDDIEEATSSFMNDVEALSLPVESFHYPVQDYLQTIKSHNPDKNPVVSGKLIGIKGQYLILDTGVINIRKFTGYELASCIIDNQECLAA